VPRNPAVRRGAALGWALLCLGWVTPLWAVRFPPMLDYPQQLGAAAILRGWHDPTLRFQAAYALSLARPQGGFEMLTAAFAWLVPLETAGKLVVALSLLAVLPAAAALCRRSGSPPWFALLALAVTYNHAFYWGFVDNLLAYPLMIGGVTLADRLLERRFGVTSWLLLALWTLLFYAVHLEFLLVFAGAVGWLAIVRRPDWRTLTRWLSPLAPGLALGAGVLAWAHLNARTVMTGFEQRLQMESTIVRSTPDKLRAVPSLLFGAHSDGVQVLLFTLLTLALLVPVLAAPPALSAPSDGRDLLFRTRFASLAAWIAFLFLALPEFSRGYLISERLLPLAFMLLASSLPLPSPAGRRAAALVIGLLLAVGLAVNFSAFRRFAAETAGLGELLAGAAPGEALAGLVIETRSAGWETPVFTHFPAYYQVLRGGRVQFSFAQFFNSPVRYRSGQNWEEPLLAEWDAWNPQRFVYSRHGGRFRYFLVRGGPHALAELFGPALAGLRVRSAGRWSLVERPPVL
jgi:hypothetical protein